MDEGAPSATRRGALAGAGSAIAAALAGCSERLWSRAGTAGSEQIELTIKTVPADDDLAAAKIVSQFRENLRDAGIGVTHEPVPEADLYRDVLLDEEYDVFVARHPGIEEYDALRGLLHSEFVNEQGWQNPFHFSDVLADDLLERQRRETGDQRRETIAELLEYLGDTVPYTTIGFPIEIAGHRAGIDARRTLSRPGDYFDLLSREPADGARDGPLEVGVYGDRLGQRLNPLVVDRNRIDGLLGLLYEPLVRRVETGPSREDTRVDDENGDDTGAESQPNWSDSGTETERVPWLAEEVSWDERGTGSEPRLRADVTLREGLEWHDGEPLEADDVVFTYRFLADTSMGTVDGGVPAPRYRSRGTIVETVDRLDDRTVRFSFGETLRPAATTAFSIPILPAHVWRDRTEPVADQRTEALTTDNEEPVGSGPFEITDITIDRIELEPVEDHVFRESDDRPEFLEGFSQYSGISFRIDPNVGTMMDSLLDGEIDITGDGIPPEDIGRFTDAEDVSTVTGRADSFYMIGYNHHHPELGNPRFRQIVSRLVDREHIALELFGGFAEPATSLGALVGLSDDEFGPNGRSGGGTGDQNQDANEDENEDGDEGDGIEIIDFPGTDGEIDVELVRSLFRDAGYRYADGELLE
ncbi:ABC transporter substrate-binding protein [Halobiforma lacisalsi AJ5]|uniref:ABC transporter periplasmic protein n=1 Tax=Natronobacterium lacisalsi AJ5 TaxID=358396 RepID=M0LEW5_NATLA|nr:ABC transporter substrate-binding protein [Halobiforma lacisalsi]APW98975.1 ABC transporter substrate-binding protein [Halobiforma lacisalsi AJ5]EMA30505.1 ABC transporter periplasmic protein [Halobiforma lacisalsi AJ5]